MADPITVLLVDDHSVVRIGLRAYLATLADIEVIGEAGSGEEAVSLATQHAPDVVLMDLIMPGMDGVEATRQVRRASPRTQVIVLTSYHEDEHIFPAIRAGALSYVLKDIDPDDLAEAIRRARAGEAVLHPRVAARVVDEMRGVRLEGANPFSELTDRELEVLRQVAAGKNNREIAEALVISEKTVKSHITNILGKLHLADRTQAAVYAWQEGIVRRAQA
ncbi:MAG TPA: response regulator transcription factor [Anaerolineae bacterium]|nr:response regulator transcription factor [Anaerolineae bacterium]HPL29153.1 response regulator transcription factor [Anaerolineae bacterium]